MKPKWVTRENRRYKVVTPTKEKNIYKSPVLLCMRNSYDGDLGTYLNYSVGKFTKSPNGVDRNPFASCTRGIHAFKTIRSAINFMADKNQKILIVYAKKWWVPKNSYKCRAREIYVSSIYRRRTKKL